MEKRFIVATMACVVSAFLLTQVAQASEATKPTSQVSAKKKAVKKKSTGGSTKFISGSQETTKERNARLTRECKGAANAGACSGFTR